MPTFEGLFHIGVDRFLPRLKEPIAGGKMVALGETKNTLKRNLFPIYEKCICLGAPEWIWPRDPLMFRDDSVAIVHAYHFFEHLTGDDAIALLSQIQRVLMPGGILQYCIPLASADIAFQDLTHKSFWTSQSFRVLMDNKYYDPTSGSTIWQLEQHYQVIAGEIEKNLCLFGQLVKRHETKTEE